MRFQARKAALWFGACAAVLLGMIGLLVALAVFRPRLIQPLAERWLAPEGGSMSLAGLSVSLFPPVLSLEGLDIVGPGRDGERLRIAALRVEADLGRLIAGGPWLERIEASGLVYERPRPPAETAPLDLTPLEWLFRIERLSLSNTRLRIALPWGELAAEEVTMNVHPGEGGIRRILGEGRISAGTGETVLGSGRIEARGEAAAGPAVNAHVTIQQGRLNLPWIKGDISGQSEWNVTREGVRALELSLAMPGARLGTEEWGLPAPMPVRLEATGSVALDGSRPSFGVRTLEIGDLLRARGEMSGPAPESLSGTVEGSIGGIERLNTLLASAPGVRGEGLELKGDLPFRADVASRGTDRVLRLALLPEDLSVALEQTGIALRLEGRARAEGTLKEWKAGSAVLSGELRGEGRLAAPPWRVRRFRLKVPLGGRVAAPASPDLRISAGEGELFHEGRPLPLGTVEVRGSAAADGGSFRLEDLDIRSKTLGRLSGEMAYRGGRIGGRLEGKDLAVHLIPLLAEILTGGEWKGWTSDGRVDVSARLEPEAEGTRMAARVAMERIGFSSPSGEVMGRNLSGRLALDAGPGTRPRIAADLEIRGGEVLWATVYVDLSAAPVAAHARFTRTAPGRYDDIALEGEWSGFGALRIADGSLREDEGWSRRGTLSLREVKLGPVFRTFVRDPLAPSHPALAGFVMKGSARLDLSFSGSEKGTDLSGHLALRVDDLRPEGGTPVLSGLTLDLPIDYALGRTDPGAAAPSPESGWGSLALGKLRLAGRDIGPFEAPAALVPNRLYLEGEIDTSLFGAEVHLGRIRVNEPLSASFRADLPVRVDGLDLARLPVERIPLSGKLGGTLDPVSIGRTRIRAKGPLRGEFFGGRLEVAGPTVERPFGPGREIGADVDVDRLDLEPFSAALGIGRITGRLSVSIQGLRVSYGQPVAFHLRMWSVPEKGVPQLVSLKAVNSISLLSTGTALEGLGYSLMTTFFRQFPYETIGIECRLKNDMFTVRGLLREDDVEYLVKRPLLGGINVINRNPDNRIRFSDMLERLKRVTGGDTLEEGAIFPPGGPAGADAGSVVPGRQARGGEEETIRCTDTLDGREASCDEPLSDPGFSLLPHGSASQDASR